jgi:hypothetical protein
MDTLPAVDERLVFFVLLSLLQSRGDGPHRWIASTRRYQSSEHVTCGVNPLLEFRGRPVLCARIARGVRQSLTRKRIKWLS